jgi:acetyl esterase
MKAENKMEMPLRIRLQTSASRMMYALPKPVRRLVAGAPIQRDGQILALDAQLMLRLQRLVGFSLIADEERVEMSRRAFELAQHLVRGRPFEPVSTREIRIPAEHGDIPCTLCQPDGLPDPSGLLVYFHGGGWVLGSRRTHDNTARFLALRAGVRVLSVEYRLAPEHVFPAAYEDALAAFDFAHAEAKDLKVDAARIAVGGDSAGGNLAAAIAYTATQRGGPRPAFQMLLYPSTDCTAKHRSRELLAEGFSLTDKHIAWFTDRYAPEGTDVADARLSVLLSDDLSGLPPAYIATAGFDPLRDEGEAYAERLARAGVPVLLSRQDDLIHGYVHMLGLGHRFREAALSRWLKGVG